MNIWIGRFVMGSLFSAPFLLCEAIGGNWEPRPTSIISLFFASVCVDLLLTRYQRAVVRLLVAELAGKGKK